MRQSARAPPPRNPPTHLRPPRGGGAAGPGQAGRGGAEADAPRRPAASLHTPQQSEPVHARRPSGAGRPCAPAHRRSRSRHRRHRSAKYGRRHRQPLALAPRDVGSGEDGHGEHRLDHVEQPAEDPEEEADEGECRQHEGQDGARDQHEAEDGGDEAVGEASAASRPFTAAAAGGDHSSRLGSGRAASGTLCAAA